MDQPIRFIADVHLGKLARMLRMLGIDTCFRNNMTRPELLRRAFEEQRILLTRDRQLPHNPFLPVLLIASEDSEVQLGQVLQQYAPPIGLRPFSLCLLCNTALQPVAKEAVINLVPDRTFQVFEQFWQCPQCGKVFWKGSHYESMLEKVERFLGNN